MANTKSAIKRVRRISKQTKVNKARKSRYKNALKKMNFLIEKKVLSKFYSDHPKKKIRKGLNYSITIKPKKLFEVFN